MRTIKLFPVLALAIVATLLMTSVVCAYAAYHGNWAEQPYWGNWWWWNGTYLDWDIDDLWTQSGANALYWGHHGIPPKEYRFEQEAYNPSQATANGVFDVARGTDNEVDVTEGTLIEATQNELKLDIKGEARTFYLTSKSTFWRGGETDVSSFQVGDDVMVRFNKGFIVEHAWANLDRVRGRIKYSLENGYRILVSRPERPKEVNIFVDERTVFEDNASHHRERDGKKPLPEGTFIDAIGLRLGDSSLLGTLVFYGEPHWGGVQEKVELGPKGVTCLGYASWYNCPTGEGRCGTCDTSRSDQTAWPAMDSYCEGCTWTCCNCSKGCEDQVYLSCGDTVAIYDVCGGVGWRVLDIVDCGPNQIDLCDRRCNDCAGWQSPLVDLTKTTFAYFYDPDSRGCFSCKVWVSE